MVEVNVAALFRKARNRITTPRHKSSARAPQSDVEEVSAFYQVEIDVIRPYFGAP